MVTITNQDGIEPNRVEY